jgi:hypothetical protein
LGSRFIDAPPQENQGGRVPGHLDLTDTQRSAILEELDRIVSDPIFSGSKRCVLLLRSITEHALSANFEALKERVLGVEVFGRDASYDAAADPIVRRIANEIRKRLAQWYQKPDERHAVRICLLPGSYVPEFDFDHLDIASGTEQAKAIQDLPKLLELHRPEIPLGAAVESVSKPNRRKWILLGAITLAALVSIAALPRISIFQSTQSLFWQPLLGSKEPVTICISDDPSLVASMEKDSAKTIIDTIDSRRVLSNPRPFDIAPITPFVDALAAQKISNWLTAHGTESRLRPSSELTWGELHRGPLVLVGAFSNPWSLILLSNLRFSVRIDPVTHEKWINDAQNPSKRDWSIAGLREPNISYVLITRFLDRETENWTIAVEGIKWQGTEAAATLIVNPSLAQYLPSSLRSARNFQIVMRTSVINGNAGPPDVLAIYKW